MSTAAAPLCRACRRPISATSRTAIACGPGGGHLELPPPEYCNRAECRQARDEAALERAIASGVIDP